MSGALPKELFNYQNVKQPVSTLVNKTLAKVPPHNQSDASITSQEQMFQFYVQTGKPATYLNNEVLAYLVFSVELATGANDATKNILQHSAYSLIRQIAIYAGANRLQNIMRYDRVMALCNDAMVSRDHQAKDIGMNWGYVLTTPDADATNATLTDKLGEGIQLATSGSGTVKYTFALPLKKTLFDTLKHSFPLGKCRSNLRVDITFNKFANALTSTGAIGAATIKDLNLVYEEIQLPQEIVNDNLYIDFEGVEGIEGKTLQASQTFMQEHIPVRTQQLKSVVTAFYNKAGTEDIQTRYNPFTLGEGNVQYLLGNRTAPQVPIQVDNPYCSELKKEFLKVWGCHKTSEGTLLKAFESSNFAVGVNLKAYTCVQGEEVLDGEETITGDLFIKANFANSSATVGTTDRQMFNLCLMDSKLVFENGAVYVPGY